ncbi:coiled-coil domain-containing protein 192 isoform X5 [Canis lupus baileyi]|uniref:coiled-coil domain-containing protein 192 isoform X5 n=1 Tax=Canis lupus familiaris TaxID=9615 RepID=UPI0003ADF14C|nr:coiled-coil domain-containing protein 192 isoform X5 [Canis lupus familiaris]XP_025288465.1 coiled-coil domain-containing protein 192 isoform X5 [Canis lupus dingo]XP_038407979.1 coiled-coil domain-containing protein 192 isoform X5 [Canis lupus familiaris]XP_038537338.1 coiled-coil domain-containing protein 192 isoform X5 [Canis lupus familiaris]|eukprot:XP_005626544.1 coiled-coil domain-containing protein 192 isoform X5 [Canis lupus familiaris]
MGECYSRKSVAPGSETPERSSITSASSESNTQQRNKIPIQLFCSTTPNPSQHHQKESLETRQMAFTLAQFEALEICLKEAEEKAKSLSEQLAASEGTKSKLLEQVSWLEGKLQALDHKEDSGESYQKIVLAKDQHIEKLQAELKTSQEQLTAHKLKHKRKLKKLQTDLATAKQEAAITVLELNEKIRTLCEGKPAPRVWNNRLPSCFPVISNEKDNSREESYGSLPPVEESDRKLNLIIELSMQVSLQTEKITQLEEVLEEKERKIQQLEAEQGSHPFQEAEDSPECLQEAPIFFNDSITPVVSDEDM